VPAMPVLLCCCLSLSCQLLVNLLIIINCPVWVPGL